LQILTELPAWAEGLPIAAKVWSARHMKTKSETTEHATGAMRCGRNRRSAYGQQHSPPRKHLNQGQAQVRQAADEGRRGLGLFADLISGLMIDSKILVRFDDNHPSLPSMMTTSCFACGARGDRIDWLVMVEG
jgi:hypothetical protein